MALSESKDASDRPWYEAFPPTSLGPADIPSITRWNVLSLLKANSAGFKTVLVDLRRTDFLGGYIRGSLNVPAQSMFYCMPTLYELFKRSGVETVVWYCGSSHGRGPRAAGWFHDFLLSKNDAALRNVVMEGGIKGWVAAEGEYLEWMEAYDAEVWKESSEKPQ